MEATLKRVSAYRWVVMIAGVESGLVEKQPNTRLDLHPYKAYAGIGDKCTYLGSFYDREQARKWGMSEAGCASPAMQWGGKEAATKAVLDAAIIAADVLIASV